MNYSNNTGTKERTKQLKGKDENWNPGVTY